MKFGVITEAGANHCLNAVCRTNSSSPNATLEEILKLAETRRTSSPERANVSRERVIPWSAHSLREAAEARVRKLRDDDDPIQSTQCIGKRRR